MPRFPTLEREATVPDILKMSPEAGAHLMALHEALLRGPSPLSAAQRELIAAYVSGLNECRYCYGVHAETAKAFEVPESVVRGMIEDLDCPGLDPRMKPILRLARKLTEAPSSVTDADTDAVYEAGWDEKALHDAIMVVCCFNFMNRLLDGHGVHGHERMYAERGRMLKAHGYAPLIKIIQPDG